MREPTFAPAYCSLYPILAQICRKHGYALAVHGSVSRDFDVVAIPWVDDARDPDNVVTEIVATLSVTRSGSSEVRSHGRILYGLCLAGEGFVDLSFMPRRLRPLEGLSEEPIVCEAFADNGEHSHWNLRNWSTGEILWSESPDDLLGNPDASANGGHHA